MPKSSKPKTEVETTEVVRELREGRNNVYYEKSLTKNLGNYVDENGHSC